MIVWSGADKLDPKREVDKTNNAKPDWAGLCGGRKNPKCKESKTDRANSHHAMLCKSDKDSRCKESGTNAVKSKQTRERTDIKLPK